MGRAWQQPGSFLMIRKTEISLYFSGFVVRIKEHRFLTSKNLRADLSKFLFRNLIKSQPMRALAKHELMKNLIQL